MIDDSLVIEALERVLKGEAGYKIAKDLNVDPDQLLYYLSKHPEYREYREKQRAEQEEITQKALERVLSGETAYSVAREMGIDREALSKRLRKIPEYREHRKRAVTEEDMECPYCEDGSLVKQSLYFWKCRCGAEFWPDENQVPEDPEMWEITPLSKLCGQADALILIRRLHGDGKNATEIARELNKAGFKTPRGADWQQANLLKYMRRHGVLSDDYKSQRAKVLEICKAMAGKQGISCKDIADRLNSMGLRTNRNRPWDMHNTRKVIRDSLNLDVNLYRTDAIMLKREYKGTGNIPGDDHPWRKAEDAGYREWKYKQDQKKGEKEK